MSASTARPGSRRISALARRLLQATLVLLVTAAWPVGGITAQQDVELERRVPLAPELEVVEISRSLRDRLELFPEIEGFQAARLLEREDGGTVLEIESLVDGELRRERRLVSAARVGEIRADLAARLAATDDPAELDRSGRGGFVLGQTAFGLAYHGWAVPFVLDLESTRAQVATYLLTAGASFYLPYRLTRDGAVSQAQRDLSLYGGSRGILYGALLGDVLTGEAADPDSDDRIRLGVGIAGSVAGSVLGFRGGTGHDQGSTALWGVMGDFGLGAGAATAYVLGPYATEEVTEREGDLVLTREVTSNPRLGHAITLASGVGGLWAGSWLDGRRSYTQGNAGALRSAGILGAQLGVTAGRAFTTEGRALVGAGLAGGLAGIVAGDGLLTDRRFSYGEGLIVNAAHVAGGATALGLTYLLVAEIDEHEALYLATSTLGSLLGAGFVYRALGSGSEEVAAADSRGLTLRLHPENLLLAGAAFMSSGDGSGRDEPSRTALDRGASTDGFARGPGARLPFLTLGF